MAKQSRRYRDEDRSLDLYLREIGSTPLINAEQEVKLARRIRAGDQMALEQLTKANLRFVVSVAKNYQNQGLSLADLINEGNIGLIKAAKRFDETRGFKFISYAVWWIRQAILKAICEKSRMIRLPLNRANELVQIEKARKEIQWDSNSEPEVQVIARQLNMDPDHVAELINISRDLVSLDTPIYDEKDSSLLSDFIEDQGYKSPDDTAIHNSLQEDINILLETLSEKEADILEYRFGLNGKRPMSLKEIGTRYKLTKERIRQIEKKALKRLQHPSRSMYLSSYLA